MPNPKAQLILNILDEMWMSSSWTDPLAPLLDGWTHEQATQPYAEGVVPVEGNINHTAYWEEYAMCLISGKPLDEIKALGDADSGKFPEKMPKYPEAAEHFRQVRAGLRKAVVDLDENALDGKAPGDMLSRGARAATRAVHSGYHAGQFSYLRRLFGTAEPKAVGNVTMPTSRFPGCKQMLLDLMDFAWSGGYSFDPFEDVTKDLSKSDARKAVKPGLSAISGIVNHMKFWEEYVTRRLRGLDTTDMAVVEPGEAPSGMPDWPQAREELIKQHSELRAALEALSDADMATPRPGKGKRFEVGMPAQWLVYGIVIHHSYHVGQIVLLRQIMGHKEYFI
jgi:uncharacterized damage-inducible protein DinB